MTKNMTPADKMETAVMQITYRHPFWAAIMLGCDIEMLEADSEAAKALPVHTMATNGKKIFWFESFVERLSLQEVMGVLVHEAMHVALKHMLRMQGRDPKIWNIACDMAINQLIIKDGFELPADGIFDKTGEFKNMTAERIYDKLLQDAEKNGGGKGKDGPAWGHVLPPTQDGSAGGEEMDNAGKSELENEINQRVQAAAAMAKSIGKMPGSAEEIVEAAHPPQVDYRERLRRIIGGDNPDNVSSMKFNKRMLEMEDVIVPGIITSGAGHVIIGLDVSGSMLPPELSKAASETNGICEDLGAKSVTLIQCDTRVQRIDQLEPGETIPSIKVAGRGGTCVMPVFNKIAEDDMECDVLIYFSDMEVWDFPKEHPPYQLVWVATNGKSGHTPPVGEVIFLN